jgi:hypothetical protein
MCLVNTAVTANDAQRNSLQQVLECYADGLLHRLCDLRCFTGFAESIAAEVAQSGLPVDVLSVTPGYVLSVTSGYVLLVTSGYVLSVTSGYVLSVTSGYVLLVSSGYVLSVTSGFVLLVWSYYGVGNCLLLV